MTEQAATILACAAHAWPVQDGPPDLEAQIRTAWGKRFRRVNHFIELALVGAKSCLAQSSEQIPRDCDVYIATEQGNVADVASITETLFKRLESPMPLEFLNVPNNMAGFYLAQGLGLQSANLTVAHRAFPFETALDIALFNLSSSRKTPWRALVGGVEECAYPLAQHRMRMGLAADIPLAEGSSWLYLGDAAQPTAARCRWVNFFTGRDDLLNYLQNERLPSSTCLAGGYGMDPSRLAALAAPLGINGRYDCRDIAPYHNTYCAYVIASFITARSGSTLLYIDRDARDRHSAILIEID